MLDLPTIQLTFKTPETDRDATLHYVDHEGFLYVFLNRYTKQDYMKVTQLSLWLQERSYKQISP